ncbi:MAG: secretin N-terminal domain-containing protein [Phycisphaerales bacterium]
MHEAQRRNRQFPRTLSLSDIVRSTAALFVAGAIAPMAGADASPSKALQDSGGASTAQAPTEQPAPTRDAQPDKSDPRSIAVFPSTPTGTVPPSQLRGVREGRRTLDDALVPITFKNEGVDAILPFIYEWTGKHVYFDQGQLSGKKITLLGDKQVPKSQALDYIFQALKMQGIAVTETDNMIFLGLTTDLIKTQPGVVLGPDEDVMSMPDNGIFVTKVFKLKHAKVEAFDRVRDLIPEDYAKVATDADSNQILLSGDIGLAKKVQTLLNMIDTPQWNDYATETFRLQYQDAGTIATLIQDLFSDVGQSRGGSGSRTQRGQNRGQPQQPGIPGGATGGGGGGELIVSVLTSMNSITVRATPTVLTEIRRLVANAWDLPPNASGSIFKSYDLKFADPVKVRDLLQTLLGGGTGSSGRAGTTNRAFAGGRAVQIPGQSGGDGSPTAAVANIFSIEAYPDSNRLVVISKTPDNYEWLDQWIRDLDQPFESGLPKNVPLKHASAVELSEILNTLLAQSGSDGGGLRLPEEGLSGLAESFSSGGNDQSGTFNSGFGQQQNQDSLRFPWQGGRAGQGAGGTPTEVSGLIGRSRIVPNPTQNSVLVMAPSEVEKKVIEIIQELDKPGRQVMITAILAEVKVGDGFSWGARIGRVGDFASPLNGSENSVTGTIGLEMEKGGDGDDQWIDWFDSSTLTISTTDDLAFFLQALSTDNSVRILQQPRVYTSDNKEAKFVAGSDVSFLQGETSGFGTTGTTSSFEQQFVGVGINVRPRITQDNNVAMEVEILLSNLSSTTINSNPVVDRRQTNTNVTVKNGQTIVISGIRREQETIVDRRLPFLGDIPLLGAAFSSTERAKEVVELVVFLVPLVVENPDENDKNFNVEELERLRMLQEPLDKGSEKMLKESKFFEEIKSPPRQTAPAGAPEATKPE